MICQAQYIVPHIETPIYVMNAAYDAWQMGGVLKAQCTFLLTSRHLRTYAPPHLRTAATQNPHL